MDLLIKLWKHCPAVGQVSGLESGVKSFGNLIQGSVNVKLCLWRYCLNVILIRPTDSWWLSNQRRKQGVLALEWGEEWYSMLCITEMPRHFSAITSTWMNHYAEKHFKPGQITFSWNHNLRSSDAKGKRKLCY